MRKDVNSSTKPKKDKGFSKVQKILVETFGKGFNLKRAIKELRKIIKNNE